MQELNYVLPTNGHRAKMPAIKIPTEGCSSIDKSAIIVLDQLVPLDPLVSTSLSCLNSEMKQI